MNFEFKKQTIPDWIVEQLNSKYQVHKSIGQEWVKQQELLLLLDGLDEVKEEQRDTALCAVLKYSRQKSPLARGM
ncbi:MAG: hypothetical protein F6K41_39395 [Symploca sp. SIO3E6]|nr:hypothetical protein [Caldora sp. SIO3E6]